MSEQPEELAITLSSLPSLSHQKPQNLTQTISVVEGLLAKSDSPNEALDWARVREVILRQNEEIKEENHRRFLQTTRLIYSLAFSGVAFLVGIVLFICNYENAAFLIVAGLIPLLSIKKPT
ncbi:MAG: hypothetical protein AB1589_41690 [Cyanobacteriota bacterium]